MEKRMKTQTFESNRNTQKPRILAFFYLLSLLLTACSSSALTSQPSEPTVQPQAGGQPPVIIWVRERQEIINGYLFYYQGIYFTDPDGDAVAMTYDTRSSSLTFPLKFPDTPIETSAEEQRGEALFIETTACWQKMELAYESRIQDQAGNLSEPVLMTMSCMVPQPLDTRPLLVAGLSTAIPIALVLLLGFWLLFRQRPAERLPALRSMILLFFMFMLLKFLQFVLHEGGHSLYLLVRGVPITLYVHPFLFSGFARPIIPNSSIWSDILGSATAIPVGLLISLLFWKRRSLALLPWVMLFPYIALLDGFNIMGTTGDFWNVVQSTGLPAALFFIPGALIVCIGIISLFSLLPLAGLNPRDHKALFVLPAALFLMSAFSFLVAHLFVPGSPIDLEYFMGREILLGANSFIPMLILGIFLTALYITLFRKLYPRLPAWLRTEIVTLTWKDLRLPGILWAVSVVIGLIIVI
jgi:hypothetical protein